jgi:hypothetical protein
MNLATKNTKRHKNATGMIHVYIRLLTLFFVTFCAFRGNSILVVTDQMQCR